MKRKGWLVFVLVLSVALSTQIQSCAKKGTSTSSAVTYGSTSSTGDFAQWTVDGSSVSAIWQVTESATGAIKRTLNITATCGAADATYGYKTCTIDSGSCTAGTGSCSGETPSAGSVFKMLEVPGTAIFVHAGSGGAAGSGGDTDQLHVGFTLDTNCSDVTGDYTFMKVGKAQRDLFGVFRLNSDFSSITHATISANTSSCNGSTNSGNCTATPDWAMSETGSGLSAMSVTPSCAGGVRTLNLGGGKTARTIRSTGGTFIFDLPAGEGGIVGMPVANAATAADFANKSFNGIAFPDNGGPQLMAVSTGALTSGAAALSSISFMGGMSPGISSGTIAPLTVTPAATAANPGYPTNAGTVGVMNAGSALTSTYATVGAIPGVFKIDGTFSDKGRVVMVAGKVNGKVLAFGSVYNWRNNQYGFTGTAYANSGAFILFEK
jgi:hypothetical protein